MQTLSSKIKSTQMFNLFSNVCNGYLNSGYSTKMVPFKLIAECKHFVMITLF